MSDDDFARFWAAYPRKVGKLKALAAWRKINPAPERVEQILVSVEDHKLWPAWTREGGAYICYPATFLSQGRWMDENPAERIASLMEAYTWRCDHTPRCPHRAACAVVSARTR